MDTDVEILQLRNELIERFGTVEIKLARIDEHTSATNGVIGRHDREIKVVVDALARHSSDCPLIGKASEIERHVAKLEQLSSQVITDQKARSEQSDRFWSRFGALAVVFGGGLGAVIGHFLR